MRAIATGRVIRLESLIQVKAIGYSFHENRNTIIAVLAVEGAINGMSINRIRFHIPKPSNLAASSNSFGISLKAEDNNKIARGNDKAEYGMANASKLFPRLNFLANSNKDRNRRT